MKIIIAAIILILAVSGISAAAFYEYRRVFYVRMCDPTGFMEWYLGTHPALKHTGFSCMSDKGTMINGLRFIPDGDPLALIVMTHGYNMSIEDYLPLAKLFTEAGFEVLMFDGTGTGISQGRGIYGLPQHILDMKSVLDSVSEDTEMKALPLLLFGHSWGGYAALNVSHLKKYPIQGILTCAAFRKSSSSMIPTIRRRYPVFASLLISSVEFLERRIFGSIASVRSEEGLLKAACPARLYHSQDDSVVSYEESFEEVRSAVKDHPEFSFISLNGRNHNLYLDPENDKRRREIRMELKTASGEDLRELRSELNVLMSETDTEMAAEFNEFFRNCLKANRIAFSELK